MTVALECTRIRLRDWRDEDLPVWRHWLQPHHRWHEFDGPYYPRPDPQQVDQMIARAHERILAGDWPDPRQRLVITTSALDELIGTVSWYWESEETNWLCIGIVIFDPTHWGHGFGYEALGLWSQYLFDSLPEIVRLDLRTWSGNHGMMRLAKKLGFTLEARFRMARIVNGEHFDGLGFGVLRSEWEELYPHGFATHLIELPG